MFANNCHTHNATDTMQQIQCNTGTHWFSLTQAFTHALTLCHRTQLIEFLMCSLSLAHTISHSFSHSLTHSLTLLFIVNTLNAALLSGAARLERSVKFNLKSFKCHRCRRGQDCMHIHDTTFIFSSTVQRVYVWFHSRMFHSQNVSSFSSQKPLFRLTFILESSHNYWILFLYKFYSQLTYNYGSQ